MELNFSTSPNGLLPAIVQDATTKTVLMLGYMNQEALTKTLATGQVTFYSRSKQRLWTKGEESGHFLELVDLKADCDQDTLLIQAQPKKGPPATKEPTVAGEKKVKVTLASSAHWKTPLPNVKPRTMTKVMSLPFFVKA